MSAFKHNVAARNWHKGLETYFWLCAGGLLTLLMLDWSRCCGGGKIFNKRPWMLTNGCVLASARLARVACSAAGCMPLQLSCLGVFGGFEVWLAQFGVVLVYSLPRWDSQFPMAML